VIAVPAGQVRLADRRTQTTWTVRVGAFRLGAHPVTRAEFHGVEGDRRPVTEVSWFDAVRHCNARSLREGLAPAYSIDETRVSWDSAAPGYRLPTEAEWEFACRAGSSGPRYGPLDEIAWHRGNSGERVHAAGELRPNAWGLHDMLGNSWDWCWDVYDAAVYGEYRVLRGGGWFDEPWSCRAGVRRRSHPSFTVDDVGFRLARNG
jgi:sulfatase modifying factor 1